MHVNIHTWNLPRKSTAHSRKVQNTDCSRVLRHIQSCTQTLHTLTDESSIPTYPLEFHSHGHITVGLVMQRWNCLNSEGFHCGNIETKAASWIGSWWWLDHNGVIVQRNCRYAGILVDGKSDIEQTVWEWSWIEWDGNICDNGVECERSIVCSNTVPVTGKTPNMKELSSAFTWEDDNLWLFIYLHSLLWSWCTGSQVFPHSTSKANGHMKLQHQQSDFVHFCGLNLKNTN